jgi:hypothetical protein
MQLSYNSAQTGGHKIMDDDDISIYTPEELERLESLRVGEFVHTCVYDVFSHSYQSQLYFHIATLVSHPVFMPKLNAFLYVCQDQVSHIKREIVE